MKIGLLVNSDVNSLFFRNCLQANQTFKTDSTDNREIAVLFFYDLKIWNVNFSKSGMTLKYRNFDIVIEAIHMREETVHFSRKRIINLFLDLRRCKQE